ITTLQKAIDEIGVGTIASVSGRYYAMDRDKRWERVSKTYQAMVFGEGEKYTQAIEVVQASYANGIDDEFVVPAVISNDKGEPVGRSEERRVGKECRCRSGRWRWKDKRGSRG